MASVPENQARTAKYALCATADDIVQNIPSEERHAWTQYSMLSRFFGERIGHADIAVACVLLGGASVLSLTIDERVRVGAGLVPAESRA